MGLLLKAFELTMYTAGGGWAAWTEQGTFQEAKDAAAKINRALNGEVEEPERPTAVTIELAHATMTATVEDDRLVISSLEIDPDWADPLTCNMLMGYLVIHAGKLRAKFIDGTFTTRHTNAASAFVRAFQNAGYEIQLATDVPFGEQQALPDKPMTFDKHGVPAESNIHIRAQKPSAGNERDS